MSDRNDMHPVEHLERSTMPLVQPDPTPSDHPSIQGLVRQDLEERERHGMAEYGTPLQTFNGRNAVRDAYEEALDLSVYLRQVLVEREAMLAKLEAIDTTLLELRGSPDYETLKNGVHRVEDVNRRPLADFADHDLPGEMVGAIDGETMAAMVDEIATWCDWANPDLETPGSHREFHYGSPCPYSEVIPALINGQPDPRRSQAFEEYEGESRTAEDDNDDERAWDISRITQVIHATGQVVAEAIERNSPGVVGMFQGVTAEGWANMTGNLERELAEARNALEQIRQNKEEFRHGVTIMGYPVLMRPDDMERVKETGIVDRMNRVNQVKHDRSILLGHLRDAIRFGNTPMGPTIDVMERWKNVIDQITTETGDATPSE